MRWHGSTRDSDSATPERRRTGGWGGWAPGVAAPHRTPANVARDSWRHPRETLRFFGVRETSTVVEILPGSAGYYLEILAPYLRDNGRYIAASRDPTAPP